MKYAKMTWGMMEAIINKLGGEEGVQDFLSGKTQIVVAKHLIDCDAAPIQLDDKEVVAHRKQGMVEWNLNNFRLHLDDDQKNGKATSGHNLREKLKGLPTMNACLLDYLLAHQELIPENWKGKAVFFWGTIYSGLGGRLRVRFLRRFGNEWCGDYLWLDEHCFNDGCPALLSQAQ